MWTVWFQYTCSYTHCFHSLPDSHFNIMGISIYIYSARGGHWCLGFCYNYVTVQSSQLSKHTMYLHSHKHTNHVVTLLLCGCVCVASRFSFHKQCYIPSVRLWPYLVLCLSHMVGSDLQHVTNPCSKSSCKIRLNLYCGKLLGNISIPAQCWVVTIYVPQSYECL